MNHHHRKGIWFDKLLWITKTRSALNLINTALRESSLCACISSRITTVIHVVRYHQINYNWFNEPYAVSQYKIFILRHAWLNLWDKHMTTGRINQVTIIKLTITRKSSKRFSYTYHYVPPTIQVTKRKHKSWDDQHLQKQMSTTSLAVFLYNI